MKSLYSTKFDSTVWAPLLLLDGPLCEASAPLVLIINQSYWCVDGGGPLYMYCWAHRIIHCEPLYIVIHGNSCGDMPSMNVKIVIQDFFGHWSALVLICLSLSLARIQKKFVVCRTLFLYKAWHFEKGLSNSWKKCICWNIVNRRDQKSKVGNVKWSQVYFSIASDVHENHEHTWRPLFMNCDR